MDNDENTNKDNFGESPENAERSREIMAQLLEVRKELKEMQEKAEEMREKVAGIDTELVEMRGGRILPKWVKYAGLISLVSLMLSGAAFYMDNGWTWNIEIISISIVLAFVGSLATFVVVSNFRQVERLEESMRKETKSFKGELDRINRYYKGLSGSMSEIARKTAVSEIVQARLRDAAAAEFFDPGREIEEIVRGLGILRKNNVTGDDLKRSLLSMHSRLLHVGHFAIFPPSTLALVRAIDSWTDRSDADISSLLDKMREDALKIERKR
ncbi:MAG: hypothetical protein LBG30_05805 [Odoribacteraceae bacterium]|jgi:uncharacterized membrane protein|nr:hypothetical protein [Odoribacteraceae bacterium]